MKRKLCSALMSAFAILLLVGAVMELDDGSTVLTVLAADGDEAVVEMEDAQSSQVEAVVEAEIGVSLSDAEVFDPTADTSLLVDGQPVSGDTKKMIVDGVTYVSLRAMALELDSTAAVSWVNASQSITVTTANLNLSVAIGDTYLVANGRYLQLPEGLKMVDDVTMIPLTVLAKAFDATVTWDSATATVQVTTGSGGIESGDSYYDADDLFWLSRIIFAESGNESLEGKIAVGNVVLNRVASPSYPNTLLGVLSQTNQFSTYKNGALADRTPNAYSIIAAKLVMDGAVIEGLETATHFDTGGNTWASRNKTVLAVIGGHYFYG